MSGKSVESLMGQSRDSANVFGRGMEEISLDVLILVRDLINQGSILSGTSHLPKLESMISSKRRYDKLKTDGKRNAFIWVKSFENPYAKFKNELIGTLCTDLSQGVELNKAVRDWNKRVDPLNYKQAKAPISEAQKRIADKVIVDGNYQDSWGRRFAKSSDIDIEDILFTDDRIKKAKSFFGGVPTKKSSRSKSKFDGIETVSIEKFMDKILPTVEGIELYLENRHSGNACSMTTAIDPEKHENLFLSMTIPIQ